MNVKKLWSEKHLLNLNHYLLLTRSRVLLSILIHCFGHNLEKFIIQNIVLEK